jgi:carboxylesterase
MLLIHGFTVTPANFREYAESLVADGYTVSVPLPPGHGRKPKDLVGIRWESWLDEVVEAYDALHGDCEEVLVCGISMGGALALQLAAQRASLEKLFLLAPAVYPARRMGLAVSALLPVLKKLGIQYWMHVAGDLNRQDGFELGYGRTALDGLRALSACMEATQEILPDVKADVVIFQGRTDHEIPANKASKILQPLGSQRKRLIWLDNSFHEIPRDYDSRYELETIKTEMSEFDRD